MSDPGDEMFDHEDYPPGFPCHVELAEIARLRAQQDQLVAALNLVMVGGNHLANVLIGRLGGGFASKYPPDSDHEVALRSMGATDTHEVWCCWAAIMTARAAVEEKPCRG